MARLVVEGEEGHVDLARRAELGGRRPEHVARVVDLGQAAHVLRREVVGAANRTNDSTVRVFPQKYLVSCHMWEGRTYSTGRSALSSADCQLRGGSRVKREEGAENKERGPQERLFPVAAIVMYVYGLLLLSACACLPANVPITLCERVISSPRYVNVTRSSYICCSW